MKIVADQNIPLLDHFFGGLGDLHRLSGRDINFLDVQDADILLVRSVTSVNQQLLERGSAKSRVKFVGSCTIGTNHLDCDYLKRQGIAWSNAPGCNSAAVVQYVLSVMAYLRPHWMQQQIGIVGGGRIGGLLHRLFNDLNVDCCVYDPFLSLDSGHKLVNFDEVLNADIITCHIPLTHSGPFPTYHLFSEGVLAKLSRDTLLINASRGEVIDNNALLRLLHKEPLQIALDVWQHEPAINTRLLSKVALATPHIAGHTVEGKQRGTQMIYQSLCDFLHIDVDQSLDINQQGILLNCQHYQGDDVINQLLLTCYDVAKDDHNLRAFNRDIAGHFDQLRRHYPKRHDYSANQWCGIPSELNKMIRLLKKL